MRTADFDFKLPPDLVAQTPAARRDASRLLRLQRPQGTLSHHTFVDLEAMLQPGDLLVLNNSRVIPARLRGINPVTQGRFELLLLEEVSLTTWWAMIRPGRRAQPGARIVLINGAGRPVSIVATVLEVNELGHRLLSFSEPLWPHLEESGEMPLPPYITREQPHLNQEDRERYQTVYARHSGSVAAPTAGLHFTTELLDRLKSRGVELASLTLHVGPGTFAPVKSDDLAGHVMHEERFEISPETATAVTRAREEHRRIIAVGTTSVRVLESAAAQQQGRVMAGSGRTRIFIYPPYTFQVVSGLITNFHLPCSTLLMLVSALAAPGEIGGRDLVLGAYAEAIREKYRFYSYGDAMLLL